MLSQFVLILPEIILISIAIVMQISAVFFKKNLQFITFLTITSLFILVIIILYLAPLESSLVFSNSFKLSYYIYLYKALVLFLSIMSIIIYNEITKISNQPRKLEFITLILFSTVGLFISISARDFITLFCGLELQSLASYAMTSFNTKDVKSSEAGLKYFVLGSLISCIMLLGISLLYGFSGGMYFDIVQSTLNAKYNIGMVVGTILVLVSILFKLSAAPLHTWTPDVYEGAPLFAVTYFAAAQKIAILIVLINFITLVIGDYKNISVDLIKIAAILSILVGSFGAIGQLSLKRLMAYSTILNVGYVLIAISLNSNDGMYAALLYMFIYTLSTIGFFACIVALLGKRSDVATFQDLQGVAGEKKVIAVAITIVMCSMIGLPPLSGFFGKYYILYKLIIQGQFTLALLIVLSSAIAAFYYLKVIKYMYFMEAVRKVEIIPNSQGLLLVSCISVGFTLLFFLFFRLLLV